jgi:antitoxin component YwqK of YwqJK toxin-antitoxin module
MLIVCFSSSGQSLPAGLGGATHYTYHDAARKHLKEVYQVKDSISKTPHGAYVSYFLNGNIESKGQFVNGETNGVWEFYFETGGVKMRGIVRQSSNYGFWEYYYENGIKSMEGVIQGSSREGDWRIYYESSELKETGRFMDNKRNGFWRTYFEDGAIKGEIEYVDDVGRYTEYYHNGKKLGEGPRVGNKNTGLWRYYTEEGTLDNEGLYEFGKKTGEWKYYFPSGKVSCVGYFNNDDPIGKWTYYFEDGKVSSSGEYIGGKRNGYWSSLNPNGTLKSEISYIDGSGEYKEYHPGGQLKVKGQIIEGKNQGKWLYYYEDGKKEGECDFVDGKGMYSGYYPNGTLQTKGPIENDKRVGTWELYEQDGVLAGYYKPLYQDKELEKQLNGLLNRRPMVAAITAPTRKGFSYFRKPVTEYKSMIIQGNPLFTFLGSLPAGIEVYNQERLGHELAFEGIRNPFFTADSEVQDELRFERGYSVALRQKLYNVANFGLWYFGHFVRYADLKYYVNMANQISPADAAEKKYEYGLLFGTRLMNKNDGDGFTIDAFLGYGIGYRDVKVGAGYESAFSSLSKDSFSHSFQIGLNFGYSISFDRK